MEVGRERLMDMARIRMKDLVLTSFRFRPTDKVLVCCYLKNKIERKSLLCDIIAECELYGVKEPWEIWMTFGGDNPDDDQVLGVSEFGIHGGKDENLGFSR